jgi:hypothetical protein
MRRIVLYSFLALLLSAAMFAATQVQQRTTGQNSQQNAQGQGTIEGTVTRVDNGQALKNARVTLRSSNRAQNPLLSDLAVSGTRGALVNLVSSVATVTTDGNGRFAITGVSAGAYQISAERDGFVRSEYGQRTPTGRGIPVQVAANQHLMIDLKMLQASVISGRVITADGEPAAQATLQAYTYQYSNGQRTLAEVKTAQTNDLGEYRLFWLEPGDYFVSVTDNQVGDNGPIGTVDVSQTRGGRGGTSGVQILAALGDRGGPIVQALGGISSPPVFYPGTVDPDGATPITVAAASDVRGMDFNLRPLRTASVSGRVVAPFPLNQPNTTVGVRGRGGQRQGADGNTGQLIAAAPVQLSLNRIGGSRTGLAGLLNLRLGATPVSPDGTFEIKGVAPGEYNLSATARDQSGQQYTARTRISVGTADVGNVTVAVRPGVEVQGRILLDGTPPQQFKFSNLRVSLVSGDGGLPVAVNLAAGARGDALVANLLGVQGNAAGAVADDGSFTLKDVGAQEYRVRVTGLPQGAYVQAGRVDSNDALNAPFTVDNQGTQLQLQLGFTPARVSGSVTDDRAAPAAGVETVLVPDEARRGRNDAYFSATTDQNGQFTFNNVPPGRYKVFAWEDIPAGAYQYPDFIRRYEDRGQPLTVNANGAITANVRLIPAN